VVAQPKKYQLQISKSAAQYLFHTGQLDPEGYSLSRVAE
jgi:hypothetical protein